MATFGDILSNLGLGAGQSVRRNAGDSEYEAYTPVSSAHTHSIYITGATNLGSGNGTIYTSVSDSKINLKTISGGTNVTITCNGNYIGISSNDASGIEWSGSTSNAIGTYYDANCIVAEPNLTFDGSLLDVTGDVCAVNVTACTLTVDSISEYTSGVTFNDFIDMPNDVDIRDNCARVLNYCSARSYLRLAKEAGKVLFIKGKTPAGHVTLFYKD